MKDGYFTLLYVGNVDNNILEKYSKNLVVQPYPKYYFKDREKYLENKLTIYKSILESNDEIFTNSFKKNICNELTRLNSLDDPPFDFYQELTEHLRDLNYDDKTGDAYTTENPNGIYTTLTLGFDENLGLPLYSKTTNNPIFINANVGDVDWEKIHNNKDAISYYSRVWEICVENSPTLDDNEERIKNNMQSMPGSFNKFLNKQEYILFNTSWWTTDIIINDKWISFEEFNYHKWSIEYYDKFIKNLSNDTKLTLYRGKY